MEIIEISPKEYNNIFPSPYHIYNSVQFNELNIKKCDTIKYLILKDNKIRFGLITGLKKKCLSSPFSAPFGGFSFKDDQVQIQKIEESLDELENYLKKNKISKINITLPPLLYNQSFLSKVINCLSNKGFSNQYIDLNYYFNTNKFDNNYLNQIVWRNARKNFNIASKNNFEFKKNQDNKSLKLAYEVIKQNRIVRGFPLRMTYEQVLKTTSIIQCDSFLLSLENKLVASAIVFHITKDIVQVIYWGDLPDFYTHKTMNFLSYKIFEYYKKEGIKIVDIGPSTEKGIPNYGLCEFKESIGCDISPKYTFTKSFL